MAPKKASSVPTQNLQTELFNVPPADESASIYNPDNFSRPIKRTLPLPGATQEELEELDRQLDLAGNNRMAAARAGLLVLHQPTAPDVAPFDRKSTRANRYTKKDGTSDRRGFSPKEQRLSDEAPAHERFGAGHRYVNPDPPKTGPEDPTPDTLF